MKECTKNLNTFYFKDYSDESSLQRATGIIILCLLAWISAGLIRPAFCHPAEVRDVVFMRFISSTHLNITIWHDIENSLHYVDTIEVSWGANTTSLTFDPKPLAPDGTFSVDYNMGPMPEPTTPIFKLLFLSSIILGGISLSSVTV